jgi:hypothetical protein
VIVNDLNMLRSCHSPLEADPILVVEADAVLPSPVTLEGLRFGSTARCRLAASSPGLRHCQIDQRFEKIREQVVCAHEN